jgi:AP-1-like factor
LEDKVAELEASNAGRTFENENLKQLLSKLQKENLALKESKFTFNVPFPGVTPGNLNQANESSASTSKPSSPPLSTVNRGSEEPGPASLRKFKEMSPASTSGISNNLNCPSNDSPNSAFDASSDGASPLTRRDTSTSSTGGVEHVFNPEPYNAFVSPGGITQYTPFAAAAENIVGGVDLQAMLNVFKAQYGQRPAAQPTPAGQSLSGFSEYREPSADPLISYSGMGGDGPGQDLSGVEGDLFGDDEAMNEFLRSLSQPDDAGNGAYNVEDILNDPAWPSLNNVNNSNNNVSSSVSPDQAREDPYSSQLRPNPPYSRESTGATSNGDQSISGASASIDPTFSPSNYFTMSPEPGLPGSGSGQGVGIMSTMAPFSSANFDRTDVNLNNVNIDGICPLTNFQAQTEGMKPEQIWTAFKDQIETGQLDVS